MMWLVATLLTCSFVYMLVVPLEKWFEKIEQWPTAARVVHHWHGYLHLLHSDEWARESTKLYIASALKLGCAVSTTIAWLAMLTSTNVLLMIALLLGIVIPYAKWRDTVREVRQRKQSMLLTLPELLTKLVLLLGAGETLKQALWRCVNSTKADTLLSELGKAMMAHRNGQSFTTALTTFNRRCAVPEVAMFTTTLLLNERRGGDRLALALQQLSYSLWERHKATVRTRAEEISSKLVFPLVIIFFVIMVIVATPALFLVAI